MAELLIRISHDQRRADEGDGKHLMAGDVITVQEDGWKWSQREQNNPEWEIRRVRGTRRDWQFLTAQQVAVVDGINRTVRKRNYQLDLGSLPHKDLLETTELTAVLIDKSRI